MPLNKAEGYEEKKIFDRGNKFKLPSNSNSADEDMELPSTVNKLTDFAASIPFLLIYHC